MSDHDLSEIKDKLQSLSDRLDSIENVISHNKKLKKLHDIYREKNALIRQKFNKEGHCNNYVCQLIDKRLDNLRKEKEIEEADEKLCANCILRDNCIRCNKGVGAHVCREPCECK